MAASRQSGQWAAGTVASFHSPWNCWCSSRTSSSSALVASFPVECRRHPEPRSCGGARDEGHDHFPAQEAREGTPAPILRDPAEQPMGDLVSTVGGDPRVEPQRSQVRQADKQALSELDIRLVASSRRRRVSPARRLIVGGERRPLEDALSRRTSLPAPHGASASVPGRLAPSRADSSQQARGAPPRQSGRGVRCSGCRDGMNPRRSLGPPGCLPGAGTEWLGTTARR